MQWGAFDSGATISVRRARQAAQDPGGGVGTPADAQWELQQVQSKAKMRPYQRPLGLPPLGALPRASGCARDCRISRWAAVCSPPPRQLTCPIRPLVGLRPSDPRRASERRSTRGVRLTTCVCSAVCTWQTRRRRKRRRRRRRRRRRSRLLKEENLKAVAGHRALGRAPCAVQRRRQQQVRWQDWWLHRLQSSSNSSSSNSSSGSPPLGRCLQGWRGPVILPCRLSAEHR